MPLFDRFPLRFVVPNAVTCASMVFGFASIRASLTGHDPERAAWFILYSVLLDKLDGAAARRLNASSEIGVQLDSFSDFVTFGLAPAALVEAAVLGAVPEPWSSGPHHVLLLATACVYALTACLRLAKFNVTTSGNDPRFFRGLASTASGGLMAAGYLAHRELGLAAETLPAMLAFAWLNAVLMVSNLPLPKFKVSANPAFRAFQFAVVASVYVLVPLHRFPTYLVSVASIYTVVGFAYGVWVLRREGLAHSP